MKNNIFKQLFGGLNMTWPKLIIFAILAAVYTAAMAIWVPDGNSFHNIAVTGEAWAVLALIVALNCKTPLDAATKTFVFFLISQPLIYLLQVPFSYMGWGLFGYYPYWFGITLLTFPAAYLAWYIKKDNIYSALILSVVIIFLFLHGVGAINTTINNFPSQLICAIFCFASAIILYLTLLKTKKTRLIAGAISLASLVAIIVAMILRGGLADVSGVIGIDMSPYISADETWQINTWDVDGATPDLHLLPGYDENGNDNGTLFYNLRVNFTPKSLGSHPFTLKSSSGKLMDCSLSISATEGSDITCNLHEGQ